MNILFGKESIGEVEEDLEKDFNEFIDDVKIRLSDKDKWLIAVIIGVLFLILAAPLIFKFSNVIFKPLKLPTIKENGMPTIFGLLLHTIVFILILRLLMH